LIIVMLALAIGGLVADRLIPETMTVAERPEIEVTKAIPDRSIAVLPFVNMSDDASNEFFSDGISEELINLLAKIPELRVAARTSSFSLRGKDLQMSEVGEILKVAHVLEGSVRKSGNRIRITTQLIHAEDGYHLWSETYDRTLDDIFAIQDEIAAKVVDELKVTLLGEAPKVRKTVPQAYALYLQAVQRLNQGGADDLLGAIELYEKALSIDANYTPAWNGLAVAYSNSAGRTMPFEDGAAKANAASERALVIDPENARAYTGLAWYASAEGDYQAAARHYRRALEFAPNNKSVLNNSALMLGRLGRFDDAITVLKLLTERDPLNPSSFGNLAEAFMLSGRLDEARVAVDKALALSQQSIAARIVRMNLNWRTGDYQGAMDIAVSLADEKADENESDTFRLVYRAMFHLGVGTRQEGEAALSMLEQKYAEGNADEYEYQIARLNAMYGKPDAAFKWLENSYEVRGKLPSMAPFEWRLESLHRDPRWQPLLVKAGKSEEQLAAIELEVALPD
jgi:TolB-like protein/Tfp pilus assembly protein PilF